VPDPSLLILIPAYNEESRIEPTLRSYVEYFAAQYAGHFRLVVVLNGCRDNTLGVVQRVAREVPNISYLDFKDPIGKGGALIEGLKLAAYGDYIGYVDADGATPPSSLLTLVRRMGEADCVIGSRWLPGAVLLQSQTRLRRFISRVFHSIVELMFWMHIADTQCPCKLMKRSAVEKIHDSLRIADLAFDVNLLVSLKRAGLTVLEVPIEWRDMVGSKVTSSLFRSALTMLLSVVRLRLIYSPVYKWLRPLRPLEAWVYTSLLHQPQPLPAPEKPATDAAKTS
jgi:glycosyltransferase involved in cell wall biosynthesis